MVVFQFANDIRAGKKVCYTLSRCPHRLAAKDATLSRWISRVRIPLGAPLKCKARYRRIAVAGFFATCALRRDSNPEGIKSHCHPRARGQKIANMSTVTNLVTAISCHQKAIWTQGVLRRRNCRHLSAKYLDICCVTLHILQKDNATGLVTVLIFDVFCPRPLIAWANQLQSGIQSVLRKQKPEPARCGPRLNTVTICRLRSTRRTGCRRRSEPASSRQPRSLPWHPRRRAAYP